MSLMKSLWFVGNGQMELREIPVPAPKENEYLIKVISTGICGSDFEGYLGKTGRRTPPMIMGHEFSGVIEKAPEGGKYGEGETVTVFPKVFCGECEYCKEGLENVCPNGICLGCMSLNGSMCEYITTEEKYIFPFKNVSFDAAAMTEPLAVAYRSVFKITDEEIKKSKNIIVIGAGTIGLLALILLKYRGAENVIVSDATPSRLEKARELGASHTINPREMDFETAVLEATGGKLCDISIEAVGITPTAENSLDALRIGGTAIWIGNAQKIIQIDMQKVVTRELSIRGNYVYSYKEFGECVRLIESGKVKLEPLMTNRYRLEDGVQAFKDLESNKDGRMLKVFLENEQ